jgi:hypothetical protein
VIGDYVIGDYVIKRLEIGINSNLLIT